MQFRVRKWSVSGRGSRSWAGNRGGFADVGWVGSGRGGTVSGGLGSLGAWGLRRC